MGIAVGTSVGVIIVLFFLFVVPIFTLQWTKKRKKHFMTFTLNTKDTGLVDNGVSLLD